MDGEVPLTYLLWRDHDWFSALVSAMHPRLMLTGVILTFDIMRSLTDLFQLRRGDFPAACGYWIGATKVNVTVCEVWPDVTVTSAGPPPASVGFTVTLTPIVCGFPG